MTRLALPAKCGWRGAAELPSPSAAISCETMPGSMSEPAISERTIWRRERWLFQVEELIGAEEDAGQRGERGAGTLVVGQIGGVEQFGGLREILRGDLQIFRRGRAAENAPVQLTRRVFA